MSLYIAGTLSAEVVKVLEINTVGGDTYIAYIDSLSASNIKVKRLQYTANTPFLVSASILDSTSADLGSEQTQINSLITRTDTLSANVGTEQTQINTLITRTDSLSASLSNTFSYVNTLSASVSADSSGRTIFRKGEISPIKIVTSNYTVTTSDLTILTSATPVSGNILSVTFFSISAQDGAVIEIKKIDSSTNDTWVSGASTSETFDGLTSIALSVPNTVRKFKSFNGKWYIF